MRIKLFLFLIIISLIPRHSMAQNNKSRGVSVFTGGMILKNSLLSTTKLGYEFNHFGIVTDFTYDHYKETWANGSKSTFQLLALSLAGRYYLKPVGRSLFAETSIGVGRPTLNTQENGQMMKKRDHLPLVGFGLGWRFGSKSTGLFGELGYRYTLSLKEVHLYTTDTKPSTQGIENISYQSWLFEKGKGSGQIYIGIGYRF